MPAGSLKETISQPGFLAKPESEQLQAMEAFIPELKQRKGDKAFQAGILKRMREKVGQASSAAPPSTPAVSAPSAPANGGAPAVRHTSDLNARIADWMQPQSRWDPVVNAMTHPVVNYGADGKQSGEQFKQASGKEFETIAKVVNAPGRAISWAADSLPRCRA